MHRSNEFDERIRRLRESSEQAAIDFVFSELSAGIVNCRIARLRARNPGLDASAAVKGAEEALQAAEQYMWKFKLRHPEFDQMTALAERLRMELESIRREKPRHS